MRGRTLLAKIFLTLILCAVPALALFGPPSQVFKGRVSYLQPTNFGILTENNQIVRVMVAQDRSVPTQVQLGVRVEVKALQGQDGLWYLDKFEKIELQPTHTPNL